MTYNVSVVVVLFCFEEGYSDLFDMCFNLYVRRDLKTG